MSDDSPFRLLLRGTQDIREELEGRLRIQALAKPEWTTAMDVRAAGLQDLWNVLRYAELSLLFIETHLGSPEWWHNHRGRTLSTREAAFEYSAFSQGSKFGALHLGASSFENTLRCLLRAVAPGAASDARKEFQSVFVCLLQTHLGFPQEDIALLELVRLTRNTVHNSGLHRPPSGQSTDIVHQGREYRFVDGAPVEFVTWAFVLDRLRDLQSLLDRIVRAPAIWSHTGSLKAEWAESY